MWKSGNSIHTLRGATLAPPPAIPSRLRRIFQPQLVLETG